MLAFADSADSADSAVTVEAGQTLAVLEAMKVHYEIVAE